MIIPECEICHEIYDSNKENIKYPLSLDCGDTYCKECLQKLINESEGEDFLCPIPKCEKSNKKKIKIIQQINIL